ncbi:MAG: hypothetical protein IJ167_11625 [Lachnospiraceae bacterium]|nr:hypothetical protein [Lachnospiraceae bacterium]
MNENKENGSIMVEATIYYPVIILVIGVIIVISLMKLQQCLVTAVLTGITDGTSVEAMDGEAVEKALENSDKLVSALSIVEGNNRIVAVESTGSLVKTVNVKLDYKIKPPGLIKAMFRGTSDERSWSWNMAIAYVTTLAINPRYMVDTMDQHILFNCSGSSFGNLMINKYSAGLYRYLNKQY